MQSSFVISNFSSWIFAGHLTCTGHEHFDIHLIDEVFHVNVDEVFTCLFTDSPFFQEFVQLRNTYGEYRNNIINSNNYDYDYEV